MVLRRRWFILAALCPPNAELESFHVVNEADFVLQMFRPITKWTARVERLEDIPETLAKASHVARSGRPGPLHAELPRVSDYSESFLQEEPTSIPEYKRRGTVVVEPVASDVERFARRLLGLSRQSLPWGRGLSVRMH
jgi:thiamine pyrophosphate-dependent acetolactate synthase large subunit-like protein